MAETKARSKTKRKPTKTRKPSATKSSNGASASRATKSRSSSSARRAPKRSTPKNGAGRADSALKAVEGTAKQAGHSVGDAGRSVGRAALKAKIPLLAGSAAAAGVAGGIALGTRQAHHGKSLPKALSRRPKVKIGPKVKIDSRDLAKVAKNVGEMGMDVGQLAAELRRTRQSANANGTKRRSPIEVVLQGLTSRSNGS